MEGPSLLAFHTATTPGLCDRDPGGAGTLGTSCTGWPSPADVPAANSPESPHGTEAPRLTKYVPSYPHQCFPSLPLPCSLQSWWNPSASCDSCKWSGRTTRDGTMFPWAALGAGTEQKAARAKEKKKNLVSFYCQTHGNCPGIRPPCLLPPPLSWQPPLRCQAQASPPLVRGKTFRRTCYGFIQYCL